MLPLVRRQRRLLQVAVVVLFTLALALVGRLTIFMVDVNRMELTVVDRPFFRAHSCLTSYTEAARLTDSGVNVFEVAQYAGPAPDYAPRFIGPLEVDLYQYPPPFLLMPHVALAAGLDFFTIRTVWFVVQVLVLLGTMILLGRWIGGTYGALVLLLIPAIWLAPPTRLGLQIGNFQSTAFPLAVVGMIAFHRRRDALGGAALGMVTASKIFPGILGILLLVQRRWSAVAWTVAGAAVLAVGALLTAGRQPFVDFIQYQLPRIESGEAFFWIEGPAAAPVNYSIYGLVTKLRLLGVPWTDKAAAQFISSAYAIAVLVVAFIGARRLQTFSDVTGDNAIGRLRSAQVWLGLLSLASFRSPFVPDAYALVGTVWLLTLMAAERQRPRDWAALALVGAAFSVVLDGGGFPIPVPTWVAAGTLIVQLAAYAVNLYVVLAPGRPVLVQEKRAARTQPFSLDSEAADPLTAKSRIP